MPDFQVFAGSRLGGSLALPETAASPDGKRDAGPVKEWAQKYQAKFGQPASLYGAYAYTFVNIMAEGLRNAGPNLTVDSFVKGMEQIKGYKTLFGATIAFSDQTRLGTTGAKLFRLQGGRWVELGDLASAL